MKCSFKSQIIFTIITALSATLPATNAFARIELPAVFGSNMVLQRESDVPVWGKASPNATVSVVTSWNDEEYLTQADGNGKWKLNVKTEGAGGPYFMIVSDGEVMRLENIMLGEVWVCSGQSNMEMAVAGWGEVLNYKKEIENANYANIRLFQVTKNISEKPLDDVKTDTNGWQECSPQTIGEFSSVAYFFARELYETQGIPVGLIGTYWGGTISEAWTSGDSLKQHPDFTEAVEKMQKNPRTEAEVRPQYEKDYAAWQKRIDEEDGGFKGGWAKESLSDEDWKSMNLPVFWESDALGNMDGVVWFRKTVDIPAEWEGKDLTFYAGAIDDDDITYFNGKEIGRTSFWNAERKYKINGNAVKAGKAVIAVRVFDNGGNGGIWRGPLTLESGDGTKMDLIGAWKYNVGFDLKDAPKPVFDFTNPNRPTVLYNGMLSGIVPFAIRGAIWYQGESNTTRAYQYREIFPLLISDWRKQWGYDFPFYFVQLANFIERGDRTGKIWAELREAQTRTLALKNTGMAVTIDIGDPNDVHPKNKQEVGHRLALIARAQVFNERIAFSGPMYRRHIVDGDKIRVSFANGRGGFSRGNLKTRDGGDVNGFEIAGLDHKFYKANAVIEGNEMVISSPEVEFPLAVRYGWVNNPENCNVCNEAGLPMSPFRTDDWPGFTFGKK